MTSRWIFVPAIFTFILAVVLAPAAHALPALQLYCPTAVYDDDLDTWVVSDNTFELWVIGDVGSKGDIDDVHLAASYYGTSGNVTITPNYVIDPSPPSLPGYNGLLNSQEFANADGHIYWSLGDFTSTADAIEDYQPGEDGTSTGTILKLMVSISGYESVHFDAFDHYYTGGGNGPNAVFNTHYVFAPNSHDVTGGGDTPDVPEPGTPWTLAACLAGLTFATARRKK